MKDRDVSNRYEIEITVRPLSDDEQDELARVLGLIPGEYLAVARIGNTLEWAADEGATYAAAQAAEKAIRERVRRGDLIVEEDRTVNEDGSNG
jgi:hypothetical protein